MFIIYYLYNLTCHLSANLEYVQIVYCTANRFTLLMSAIMNYNMQTLIQRERSPYVYYPCEKDL
jgi:hypothetical protein